MTASEHTELLPCPFCGRPGEIASYNGRYDRTDYCGYCAGCDLSLEGRATEAEAIAAWNRRAPDGAEPVPVAWLIRTDERPVVGIVRTKAEADRYVQNVIAYERGPHTNIAALPLVVAHGSRT